MSKFYDNAVKKVNQARNFLMKGGQRNLQGYLETANRILTTAKNYEMSGMVQDSTFEPMGAVFRGFSESRGDFSEGPGVNGVANTYGIDVVDISILTSVKSFLPYLAVDRGMTKPTDLLTYQKLVAVNDAGGLSAGDTAVEPFAPINRNLSLSRSGAKVSETLAAGETSITVAFPIAKGKIRATYNGVLGGDYNGDGKMLWQGAGVDVTIDYAEGTISLAAAADKDIEFELYPDTTSESTGANTLKLRPQTENITVTAESNRVILESSMEQIAYMNRLLSNSIGTQKEFGQIALQQLLNAFVYWINADLVSTTWDVAVKEVATVQHVFDMTEYYASTGFDKFSSTKNDKMNLFMTEVDADILNKSNQGTTYYLVGMQGGNLLANNSEKFVKSELFGQQLNGVIGTFNGVPVLRHDQMTARDAASAGYANIVAGHRDASGAAAPVIYGEYLPMYSTKAGVNFQNPTQLAQALFNMSKSTGLITNFITRAQIKYA